ncbi:MAG: acyl-CoA dehydrogenase family protein [Planctomycetota bacterium]
MSKYFCSEMSNTVSYDAIQVLGGSGYMRDYACERYARDARITTIYEGTSQLQVVAAVRGVCGGTGEKYLTQLAAKEYGDHVKDLTDMLAEGTETLLECAKFAKGWLTMVMLKHPRLFRWLNAKRQSPAGTSPAMRC